MITHLIDSNILIDIVAGIEALAASSQAVLDPLLSRGCAGINQIVYAEVLAGYAAPGMFDAVYPPSLLKRVDLPWEAAWLAGRAHREYRARRGSKTSPMPDFYVGAHAQIAGLTLVTRDAVRYRTYFPAVPVVTP